MGFVESRVKRANLMAFFAGSVLFALITVLYLSDARTAYTGILSAWGVDAYAHPFLDTDTILSAVRCRRLGVDVFVRNPCDEVGRVFDYSPLWLLLRHLPVTPAWLVPAGLAIDAAFLLSLLLLPVGRDRTATARIVMGVLAPAVVYAVERGNNDLVLFVLAAIAATLAGRSRPVRLLGYAAALLAGLLKYYPMTLMLLALREQPARFLAVAAASVAIVAFFLVTMGSDLMRALELVPVGPYLSAMFGSSTLPGGLALIAGWSAGMATALRLLLSIIVLAVAAWIGATGWFQRDIERLTERERDFLLVGALLILGCFFTAQNIGYRATHLLLVVPALTALCSVGSRPRLYGWTLITTLGVMWAQCWRQALDGTTLATRWPLDPVRIAGWLLREAMWWWTIGMLAAATVALLLRSDMRRIVIDRLNRSRDRTPDTRPTAFPQAG